jgi:hypothetical protein
MPSTEEEEADPLYMGIAEIFEKYNVVNTE